MKKLTLLTILLSVFYVSAYADQTIDPAPHSSVEQSSSNSQPQGEEGKGQRPPGPPQVAIDACKGKAKNDVCSFSGMNNMTLEGTCFQRPDGQGALACLPKPPKIAIDACNGKAVGDSCSFTGLRNNNVTGTCFKRPGAEEVACRPAHPPRPEEQKKEN